MRTDRVALLLDQLDSARDIGLARLAGMTSDEFFWEPAANAWSLRPRAQTSHAFGPGEWQLDFVIPEPDPPPITTIAWRLAHLTNCMAGRWEWTFGARQVDPADVVDFAPDPDEALAQLADFLNRWRTGIDGLDDSHLDQVGYGTYPWGYDPHLPIISIVWWCNREVIHHLAEAAVLRDLWRVRSRR